MLDFVLLDHLDWALALDQVGGRVKISFNPIRTLSVSLYLVIDGLSFWYLIARGFWQICSQIFYPWVSAV